MLTIEARTSLDFGLAPVKTLQSKTSLHKASQAITRFEIFPLWSGFCGSFDANKLHQRWLNGRRELEVGEARDRPAVGWLDERLRKTTQRRCADGADKLNYANYRSFRENTAFEWQE